MSLNWDLSKIKDYIGLRNHGQRIMRSQGQRVRLIRADDPYTKLKPGSLGTVMFVDDMGTVHVKWDSGSTLGLIPGHDQWEEVTQ